MDNFYDHENATKIIDTWTETMKGLSKDVPTIRPAAFMNMDGLKFKANGNGPSKLTVKLEGGRSEAIVTVVGILRSYDLPPVRKNNISSSRVPFARAQAEIVGYKSTLFATAISNVQGIMYDLATSFAEDSVVHWTPDAQSELFGPALSGSCRYFTIGSDVEAGEKIPFAKYVDPANTLGFYLVGRVSHCEDNHVSYLTIRNDK
ncbi:hypothetical protein FB451DRAFT_1388057 [Mycena latifolia]|nr:hypothetical protein FB451DRAFT_1388057 [Mycena latifolia]